MAATATADADSRAGAAFDRAWERARTLDTASVVRYALEEASDARREAG